MVAIGWLIIMLGIAALINGFHGKSLWSSINTWLTNLGPTSTQKASS